MNYNLRTEEEPAIPMAVLPPEVINMGIDSPLVELSVSGGERIAMETDVTIQLVPDDPYEGEYTVTPKAFDATVLETRYKTMTDNLTVTKVPYFETHSDTGTTVYIAEE